MFYSRASVFWHNSEMGQRWGKFERNKTGSETWGWQIKKEGGREGRTKNTELSFLSTHPFIDFSMLQLYKASTDSSNVALLIREGDPPRSLGVLQLRVCVDASVANAAVQAVHDHGQLHCKTSRTISTRHSPRRVWCTEAKDINTYALFVTQD